MTGSRIVLAQEFQRLLADVSPAGCDPSVSARSRFDGSAKADSDSQRVPLVAWSGSPTSSE
jgi:hypothetical protein